MNRFAIPLLLLACTACTAIPENATELRVLSYNIKHGYGNDGEVDISRAAALIRRIEPDLVVLQEIDNGVRRSGQQDQMAVLAELTGLHARFGAFMPYQGGDYGIGLMSRFPILETRNHVLPEGAEPRTALDARVQLPNADELLLCAVHLYRSEEERMAQARTLVDLYKDTRTPMIIGGDFNSKPGSEVMDLMESHWINTDKGEDRFTMSSTEPRSEIDFVLFRPSERFQVVSIDVLDEPLVSDHRPVLMVLKMRPSDNMGSKEKHMSVEKDESGRRSVQVEVEVPGTPEEVWPAVATGPGIASWFVPTTIETDEHGRPVRAISDFGPGMESVSTITEWNPPHRFAAESADLGPDAPKVATEWIVEPRGDGMCTVRVVHSLVASTDDWDSQLEGWESGWPDFFRILRLYLAHFPGQPCAPVQLQAMSPLPRAEAWSRLSAALGFVDVVAGGELGPAAGAPPLRATVEHVGDAAYPEQLLLRLDEPAPGVAHLFAMEMGEQTLISLRIYFYGEQAESAVSEQEPRWGQWLAGLFP